MLEKVPPEEIEQELLVAQQLYPSKWAALIAFSELYYKYKNESQELEEVPAPEVPDFLKEARSLIGDYKYNLLLDIIKDGLKTVSYRLSEPIANLSRFYTKTIEEIRKKI